MAFVDPGVRIVAAANKCILADGQTVVLVGARHCDSWMIAQLKAIGEKRFEACDDAQGFITNRGKFVNRTEAWKIAEAAGQIIRRCGGDEADGGTLYSENLY